jgi:glycosyltransferase involved in cell wall biosynthesis
VKIFAVVHDYLPEHIGGTELHTHQMALEMKRRGHDVTVLFTERDTSRAEGAVRWGELDGVRTLELVHQREFDDLRGSFEHPIAEALLARLLAEEKPDIVHFQHLAFWGPNCLAIAKRAGAAVVHTAHDYGALCGGGTLLSRDGEVCQASSGGDCHDCISHLPLLPERWRGSLPSHRPAPPRETLLRVAANLRRFQYRQGLVHARKVICPSHFLGDLLVQRGVLQSEQVVVMKAGYPGRVAPPRPRREGTLRIGYVGGLYPSKGVHVLCEAFARIPHTREGESGPELHLFGVLEWFPDYVAKLREIVQRRKATFHGRFDPARVDEVFGAVDLIVVPSIWFENQPITIQEAFRLGIPVLASDFGGMAEAVRHGIDGLHFRRGDPADLAGRLTQLDADRGLLEQLGRGRPHVPTLSEIGDELEALYESCLSQEVKA